MRQIAFDTETTGRDPKTGDRIIEIGAVVIEARMLTEQTFQVYLNPERGIDPGALKVHGLTERFLQDKPLFPDVVDAFLEFVSGAELIIHNAPFDVGFINAELARLRRPPIETVCSILDTLPMARKKHPGQRNSLDALCKRYGVDLSQRTLHGALLDANLLARVYLLMTSDQSDFFADTPSSASDVAMDDVTEHMMVQDRLVHDLPVMCHADDVSAHEAFVATIRAQAGRAFFSENQD